MCCFILRVSPVLVKVYDFFPSSMCGHVRQPCLELQLKLPGGREGGGFRLKGHEFSPDIGFVISQ